MKLIHVILIRVSKGDSTHRVMGPQSDDLSPEPLQKPIFKSREGIIYYSEKGANQSMYDGQFGCI
jgi:hypothetical protein